MKKYLFLILIIVVGLVFYYQKTPIQKSPVQDSQTQTITSSNLKEIITQQFSQKYQKSTDNLIIEVSNSSDKFAKGSVSFKDELGGGGLWFAAKEGNDWKLVHDGQGPMNCEIANKYNFPADMVPGCIDSQNNNNFIQR